MQFAPRGACRHVVVIVTIPGRADLFARALSSVRQQSKAPDRIVVVIDDPDYDVEVAGFERVRNRRTKGLAGALNSALDHLLRTETQPADVVVSFLDDDDSWSRDYVASVAEVAVHGDLFAAGLDRHDAAMPDGKKQAPPSSITISDFLRGNPGIQGSNLSVRLSAVLEAGLFNEALQSCTDRDVCIRLLDVGARYCPVPSAFAVHDTLHGQARLSDRGSASKIAGLDAFYATWRLRMTDDECEDFGSRAMRLFDWQAQHTPDAEPPTVPSAPSEAPDVKLSIVCATIVDGSCPQRAKGLMSDLARLKTRQAVDGLWVILLENGDAGGFDDVESYARGIGLRVLSVARESHAAIAKPLGIAPQELTERLSIAVARSLLQLSAGAFAEQLKNPIVWVLDDDARLPDDLDGLLLGMRRARDADVDVALGPMLGAPPVPHSYALRNQSIDLVYLLRAAGRHAPDEPVPSSVAHNAPWSTGRRDYYNDLSRSETDRLETPFLPPQPAANWRDLLNWVGERLATIFRGEQVFRPVAMTSGPPTPSVFRGGNTLVLKTSLLTSVSNLSPLVNGRRTRRSDMFWATASAHLHGANVCSVSDVAVRQDRTFDDACGFDVDRTVDDVLGYACARAADEALSTGRVDIDAVSCRKYAEERLASLALSAWRVIGAMRTVGAIIAEKGAWWADDEAMAGFQAGLRDFHATMTASVTLEALATVQQRVRVALKSLTTTIPAAFDPPSAEAVDAARAWVRAARATAARALIGTAGEWLGAGREGVVLRVGDEVLKVFDLWTCSDSAALPNLQRLIGDDLAGAIPLLLRVEQKHDVVIAVSRSEQTAPVGAATAASLHQLLLRFMSRGWAHWNLNPSNLRQAPDGSLRLVDVGKSLHPAAAAEDHARMLRKAMVMWRFPHHPQLAALLAASANPDQPEAVGWRTALQLMTSEAPKARLDERVAAFAAHRPGPMLDLGCGKPGALSRAVAPRQLMAHDVDEALRSRWNDQTHAAFLDRADVERLIAAGERWDTLVNSLVLCSVDDEVANDVVGLASRAMNVGARALVIVCDPTSFAVSESTSQSRIVRGLYAQHHSYTKLVNGRSRCEHHRPIDAYRQMFARFGLRIVREECIDELDVSRFERVGAFVLFELEKLQPLAPVSLLITACALDAQTIDVQVRHLVSSLGRPRAFSEVVIAVDDNDGPFARAHTEPDRERLNAVLLELLSAGVVSRIFRMEPSAVARTNDHWFGIESTATRAVNGQPATLFLAALDACAHDVVLHVDVDVMVARSTVDLVGAACEVFDRDERIVSLSLPALHGAGELSDGAGAPHRIEVTGGWLHRARLRQLAPFPNEVVQGRWRKPWHRAVDERVRSAAQRSVRQGHKDCWFVTPDNARKSDVERHLLLIDRIEAGEAPAWLPPRSTTTVLGLDDQWLGTKRAEQIVVVCAGRNVPPGRVTRFFDALRAQRLDGVGVIVIDDASDNGCLEVIEREVRHLPRCTFIRRRRRVGQLANAELAIRHLMTDPEAVIVLADLDDALAAPDALSTIRAQHDDGADVVVGTMVRTDKPGVAYAVDFEAPRRRRGGNVWVHPRTFRRRLFLAIDAHDLRSADGLHFELASDWAFMLPIVEMASDARSISKTLVLHEPSGLRTAEQRLARESIVGEIVSKPAYPRRRTIEERARTIPVFCYHRVLPQRLSRLDDIYRARGMAIDVDVFEAQLRALRRQCDLLTLEDFHAAVVGQYGLPRRAALVTFDDGYVDFVQYAMPTLLRLGVPATLFVRTPLTDGLPHWAPLDLLYAIVAKTDKVINVDATRQRIVESPPAQQMSMVRELARAFNVDITASDSWRRELYMSASDVEEVSGVAGIAIGSHGSVHVRGGALSKQAVAADYNEAIKLCRSPVRALAYPDGDVGAADAAADAGFDIAFGLGVPWPQVTLHRMRRVVVGNTPESIDTIVRDWSAR